MHQREHKDICCGQNNYFVQNVLGSSGWLKGHKSTENNCGGRQKNNMRPRSTCTRMTRREKFREGKELVIMECILLCLWSTVEVVAKSISWSESKWACWTCWTQNWRLTGLIWQHNATEQAETEDRCGKRLAISEDLSASLYIWLQISGSHWLWRICY